LFINIKLFKNKKRGNTFNKVFTVKFLNDFKKIRYKFKTE